MGAEHQLVVAILEETDGYVDLHPDQARRVIRKLGWLAELDRVTAERDRYRDALGAIALVSCTRPRDIARRVLDGKEATDGR